MTSSPRLHRSLRTTAFTAIFVIAGCISLQLARFADNLGNRVQARAMTASACEISQTAPASHGATSGADLATIRNMPFARIR